ncbi:antitoxin [Xenorhabdus mauleonii]|uniref:antitoxin n=1 Tax=Xenorhabdus mauleonii TaxID=351675 RepID=UPI000B834DC6|nr:antitoxin [Xenorhabdus mauleonii]
MPNIILSDTSAGIRELKKSPMPAVNARVGHTAVILNRNQPAFYYVSVELYERMLDLVDEQELARLVT